MNQSFPCMYGPIYHGTIFFYFLEKYLKFFGLPTLFSKEKNSSDHHNSYNKGPNLAFFSFTESASKSLLTIKFPKNHITSSYHRNLPKIGKAIFGHQRAKGINHKSIFVFCSHIAYLLIYLLLKGYFFSKDWFFVLKDSKLIFVTCY
jgi:hypothetical protein